MARLSGYISCSVFISCCTVIANCGVITAKYESPTDHELSFMKRFGYLPVDESGDFDYAYTAHSISDAVKKLQEFGGLPITGILDVNTKKLFYTRRCGIKDIEQSNSRKKRYVAMRGWNKKIITFKVINGTSTLGKSKVEEIMKTAFDVWAPHGQLQFVITHNASADIVIIFTSGNHGDGNSFDGPGNIVAHAFAPPHGGMHFDDDEVWGENELGEDEEVTDLFAVAVHEVGHALGLGHSSVKASIMYPYYRLPAAGLAPDDITAMHELYLEPANATPEDAAAGWGEGEAPKSTAATAADQTPPNICSTDYTTVAVINYQIFVFKDKWMWIFRDQKLLDDVYPIKFYDFFKGIPSNISIEAIYKRMDGNIALFTGQTYWLVDSKYNYLRKGSLQDYHLPDEISKLQAVFRSNYNNKTYMFQRDKFYRFDESSWTMDRGYPKAMQAWRKIPLGIKSVVVWKGETYFFIGPRFWRFDNKIVSAHENYPLPTTQIWFGCPEEPSMAQYFTYTYVNSTMESI